MTQTSVKEKNTVRIGSAKVEIGNSLGALVDVGAIDGAEIEVSYDHVKIQSGNAGVIKDVYKNMEAHAKFNMFEVNMQRIHEFMGGLTNRTAQAGTPLVDHQQDLAANTQEDAGFVPFEYQNADGSVPANISVEGDPDGTPDPYVLDTDYRVIKVNGKWGVQWIAGGDFNPSEVIRLEYDVTPAQSETVTLGSSEVEISPRVVRFTNTNSAGKIFRVTLFKAVNEAGLSLSFPDETSDEVMKLPVDLAATCDSELTDKAQLLEIYDEQRFAA